MIKKMTVGWGQEAKEPKPYWENLQEFKECIEIGMQI